MNLRNFILQAYPNTFHISLIAISTALSLTLTASFIPLTLTLTMLLVYAPILLHRPHRFAYTTLLWIFITLCGSFARLVPTLDALSTAGTSVAVLLSITSFSSALAIFAIFLDVGIRMRTGTPQAVLFPAIWMTLWTAASHMPLGRLISWSPVLGIQSYSWMVPWVGPGGIDWLVAAWAVVISQSIGIWYMGNSEDEEVSTTKTTSSSSGTFILTVILAALTIPAFIISSSPLPVNPPETITQLTLGCALPPHHDTSPTLSDYIAESNSIHHTTTTLILWPEGAVSFRNATDRDAGFKHIQKSIGQRGTYWAVSFEETIPDPSDASNRTSISRTGVAILSDSSIHHPVYYKRHLVPIAESFPFTPGSSPPSSYTLALHRPKNVPKAHWGPSTRPLELTSSICLDFAMPSPFRDLDSRPALILAPARTWDPAIGARMWEEVKQRANEIGSLALWCDGGKGGVSGVAGAGYNDVYQVGEGSWSRTVGIAYPFDTTRTFYARSGDALVFAASWLFVIGPIGFWLVLAQYSKVAERLHGMGIKCFEWVTQNRRRTPPAANLIDFGD